MDILRQHLIKVNILHLLLSGVLIYISYRFYTRKEKFKKKKVSKPWAIVFAIIFFVLGIYSAIFTTLDNISYKNKEIIATITKENRALNSGFIYKKILLSEKKGSYYVYFGFPQVYVGKTYKFTYAPRSKIILKAEEINP